jgi:hypothetical protein
MKVTVNTRHDSLEEALATVHAAFGSRSSRTQPAPAAVATERITRPAPAKKVARSTSKASAARKAPASKGSGEKGPAKKAAARRGTSAPNSTNPISNIAPPGQADAIRAWAKTRGMEVKQAGRLPAVVIQAYQERLDR